MVEFVFKVLEFLTGLGEFALRSQVLIIRQVPGSGGNERRSIRADGTRLRRGVPGCPAGDDGAGLRRAAAAVRDDGCPPKSAARAVSKSGPYASRSCSASTTRRSSGMGLCWACR